MFVHRGEGGEGEGMSGQRGEVGPDVCADGRRGDWEIVCDMIVCSWDNCDKHISRFFKVLRVDLICFFEYASFGYSYSGIRTLGVFRAISKDLTFRTQF